MTNDPIRVKKIYGYLRTSKDTSDLENQENSIVNYCNINEIRITDFIEDSGVSGYKTAWKDRKLFKLINETCERNDYIIIFDITRIARKMADIHECVALCQTKQINFIDVCHNLVFEHNPKNHTQRLLNTILISVFAMASEIERCMISERTLASLKNKQEKINKGEAVFKKITKPDEKTYELLGLCGQVRVIEDENGEKKQVPRKGTSYKSKFDVYKEKIILLLNAGIRQKDIAEHFQLNVSSLNRYIAKNKLKGGNKTIKYSKDKLLEVLGINNSNSNIIIDEIEKNEKKEKQ